MFICKDPNLMSNVISHNGLRGFDIKNETNWLDYVTETQYKTGVLYYVKLRKENAKQKKSTGTYIVLKPTMTLES